MIQVFAFEKMKKSQKPHIEWKVPKYCCFIFLLEIVAKDGESMFAMLYYFSKVFAYFLSRINHDDLSFFSGETSAKG